MAAELIDLRAKIDELTDAGLKREVIADRLNRGWSIEKTLTTPTLKKRERIGNGTFAKTIGD